EKSDAVFFFVLGLSLLFLVFITALMIYFVVRYSKKRHPNAAQIEGHTGLEILWTIIPLAIFLAIFYYGWTNYEYMRQAPRDSMVIKVTARQWSWSFEYPNGKQSKVLFAPISKPMKLEVRSADVVHGFFVPSFRLKIDAVPSRANTTWFEATKLGAFDIECTVICGVDHSLMLSKVIVVPEEEFKAWYFGGENAPEPGKNLPVEKPVNATPDPAGLAIMKANGCMACHSVTGAPMVGPTLKGLFGKQEEVLVDGKMKTVLVDEAQLRTSIQDPMREITRGYPPAMPKAPMKEADLAEVVAYIKTLK
ncbi:MAG: cytochrome c oxidase subunit II, partial [Holophaga sp.]|nr:cytochrome c oxidase subunit II [Holophaga sp.]